MRRTIAVIGAALILGGLAFGAATANAAIVPASQSARTVSAVSAIPTKATRTLDWIKSYGRCSQIGWSGSGGSLNAGAHLWTKICRSDLSFPFVLADCGVLAASIGGAIGVAVGAVVCTPIADWAITNGRYANGVWLEIYYGRIKGCTFHQRGCSWNAGTW